MDQGNGAFFFLNLSPCWPVRSGAVSSPLRLQEIQEAIDVFQKKNETFRLAFKEVNLLLSHVGRFRCKPPFCSRGRNSAAEPPAGSGTTR